MVDPEALPGERSAVVVGGGIGGLAAARALQTAGWTVRLLERAARFEPIGAGISLWPNATRALDLLGVRLPVPDHALGSGGVQTRGGRWLTRTDPAAFASRYGTPLVAVHRGDLQRALLDALLPGTVRTGTTVSSITSTPEGAVVAWGFDAVSAGLVVVADGATSAWRQVVTGARPAVRYAGYTAWRGVTRGPAPASRPTGPIEVWGRGERFGVVPLADGRSYWFATANTPAGRRAPDGEHGEVRRRFASWQPMIGDVLMGTEPEQVLRHDVVDLRPHPVRYVRDRVVLLGDAAHAMTPNLGQGACQALEDAVALRAAVSSAQDLDAALGRYDAVRRFRARQIATRSRRLGQLGQATGAAAVVRDLVLPLVPAAIVERGLAQTLTWEPLGAARLTPG